MVEVNFTAAVSADVNVCISMLHRTAILYMHQNKMPRRIFYKADLVEAYVKPQRFFSSSI